MGTNTGSLPSTRFLPPLGGGPQNLPEDQELRIHAGQFYLVPEIRGKARGTLFEALMLDRDLWILEQMRRAEENGNGETPVARFRGNIKPGCNQKTLLGFYVREGWCVFPSRLYSLNARR